MMSLVSTRTAATASPFEAVLCGLAPDGGLYVPASLPTWTLSQIQDLVGLPYEKAAALILHGFFDEISQEKMEAFMRRSLRFIFRRTQGACLLDRAGVICDGAIPWSHLGV